jgi:glycosyltransferase involved in cell wall biosynthesis
MNISVVILTFNSERTLANTLALALRISNDIHVVDSFSSDRTVEIAKEHGANVVTHHFGNYAQQRNWAIENLPLVCDWELHLDADEQLSEELIVDLARLDNGTIIAGEINGYHIARLVRFLGRPIKHGGMFPIWHMRLFRRGVGRCEQREYDQHFMVRGPTGKLRGFFIDDIRMSLSEWIIRHNRWSDAEVSELNRTEPTTGLVEARLFGTPIERKRYLKSIYERCPALSRAWLLFLYRYLIRGGFLDGREGAVFFALQTFWFRFLVDAKLFEQELLIDKQHPGGRINGNDVESYHGTEPTRAY